MRLLLEINQNTTTKFRGDSEKISFERTQDCRVGYLVLHFFTVLSNTKNSDHPCFWIEHGKKLDYVLNHTGRIGVLAGPKNKIWMFRIFG